LVVLANVIVPWLVTMLLPFKNVSNTPLPLRFWIMLLVVFVNTPFTSNWLRVPAPFVALNEIVPLFMYRLLLEKVAAVAPKLALPIWTVPLLPSKVVPVTLNTCELRIIKNPRPEPALLDITRFPMVCVASLFVMLIRPVGVLVIRTVSVLDAGGA